MACEARAARGSLIYILEMISLRIEPRNFEDYLYITVFYIVFHVNHYLVTIHKRDRNSYFLPPTSDFKHL